MESLIPFVTFIGGFFLLGFIAIVFGLATGNNDVVKEGAAEVGKGCLWLIGTIAFVAFLLYITIGTFD